MAACSIGFAQGSAPKNISERKADMSVRDFIRHNYRHFNAAVIVDASDAYMAHLARGGKMFLTMAGAMSTAELGLSLAEMIRQDKVHGICTTGANLEEDIFNLVAHNHYQRVPHYRNLSDAEEVAPVSYTHLTLPTIYSV